MGTSLPDMRNMWSEKFCIRALKAGLLWWKLGGSGPVGQYRDDPSPCVT